MNLVTVYKAFRKQAAPIGFNTPAPGGDLSFKMPPPITAPGSQPLGQPADQSAAPADPTATPDKSMQMLEKGWEKTMDTMKQMTAMNNGVPVAESGATPQEPVGAGVPGQAPMPTGGITPQPLPKMATVDYGTVYKSLMKRASWLGRQVNNVFGGDTWMGRTFGESPETAAENFYNSQISPEMQAQRKADAAAYDKQLATQQQRINGNLNTAVAQAQQQSQAAKNQQLAKQKAADKYIQQLAAQQGVTLSGAQRNQIAQNAGIRQPQTSVAQRAASKPQQSVASAAQNATAKPMTTLQAQKARATQQQQLRKNDAAIRRRDVAAFNRGARRPVRG